MDKELTEASCYASNIECEVADDKYEYTFSFKFSCNQRIPPLNFHYVICKFTQIQRDAYLERCPEENK